MRAYVAVLLCAVLAGCGGSSTGEARDGAPTSKEASAASPPKVERCVDRLLARSPTNELSAEQLRRYIETTYCRPFATKGWVYEDGALSIGAHESLQAEGTCVGGEIGRPERTLPCGVDAVLDCALLHHVRRREVRAYVEKLRRGSEVECDDGTPVERLGVP